VNGRCLVLLLAMLGVALGAAVAAAAQPQPAPLEPQPAALEPQREVRTMWLVGVAGADGSGVLGTAGGLGQVSIAKQRVTRPPDCPVGTCIEAPRLYLHGLGALGVAHRGRLAAQGQLGVVARTGNAMVPYAGVVALYVRPFDRVGPALRLDVFDNVGVTAGWVFGRKHDGFFVGIDVYHRLLESVGLF